MADAHERNKMDNTTKKPKIGKLQVETKVAGKLFTTTIKLYDLDLEKTKNNALVLEEFLYKAFDRHFENFFKQILEKGIEGLADENDKNLTSPYPY